jgi:hypothetical protein
MRKGIIVEVDAADRVRLEAVVGIATARKSMSGGRGSCC